MSETIPEAHETARAALAGIPFKSEADLEAQVAFASKAIARALLARDERAADLMEALMRIHQWCEAYPIDVFPEPDFKRARQLLAAGGIAIDAVSASNMRHVANGIKSIAASAIRDRSKT